MLVYHADDAVGLDAVPVYLGLCYGEELSEILEALIVHVVELLLRRSLELVFTCAYRAYNAAYPLIGVLRDRLARGRRVKVVHTTLRSGKTVCDIDFDTFSCTFPSS